jgi:hypothetical protein
MQALEQRLAAALDGMDRPTSDELLQMADMCMTYLKRHAAAVQLYRQAFNSQSPTGERIAWRYFESGREDPLDGFPLTQKSFCKVYRVPFEAGQPYLIDLEGMFDTFLRIEDGAGKHLLFNNDMTPSKKLDSRLVFIPSSKDTYRLVVTSFKPEATGSYTLWIRLAAKVGDAVALKGTLDNTKPPPQDGKAGGGFKPSVEFELVGGSPYTLELTSPDQDASFWLVDAGNRKQAVASAGYPARLDFTPESTGVFRAFVFAGRPGQTGTYALTIQRYEETKKSR